LFGLQIRWYAVAYILAFAFGILMIRKLDKGHDKKYYDDLFSYMIFGVIIGGRLGYVLFYNMPFFIENPLEIFMVWHGGMSFHGGLAGVIAAAFLFAAKGRKNKNSPPQTYSLWQKTFGILDMLAFIAPVGLFLGRIANFINMELIGRPTDSPLGVVFKGFSDVPRHPSPLYEAGLEGIVLFAVMLLLWRTKLHNYAGAISGIFAILYGLFRIFCEQFREPDAQLGFLLGTGWLTMGMILSFAMAAIGAGLTIYSVRRNR
jgi:phosphatidylglycerol:prolipoprotein diacylglycerol transferase